MHALIIGGGIGGCSAAIALAKVGIGYTLYERASEPREVGAGISLWSNALRVLDQFGVGDAVRASGEALVLAEIRNWKGKVLSSFDYAQFTDRFRGVAYVLHRAELLNCLFAAIDPTKVKFNHELTGLNQDGAGVTARFSGGQTARADLLIGADGLNSTVRGVLFGNKPPRYSGQTCWRGICEFPPDRFPPGHAAEVWGPSARFGITRIGRGRVYWWATHTEPAGGRDEDAKSALASLFARWHDPIPAVIEATDAVGIIRNDIFDREPVDVWSRGRVLLIGDAAHPTTPNYGQGGCMAIEDGLVLARLLKQRPGIFPAFRAFEAARGPRTAMITRRSRASGRLGQLPTSGLCFVRDLAMRAVSTARIAKDLERIVAVDV